METKENYNKKLSYNLLMTTFVLCSIGLLANYSASALKSYDLFGSAYLFLYKQLFGVTLGFFFVFLIQKMPTSFIERAPLPFFGLTTLLLALVFVPGVYHKVGGAARWIRLGPISLQPAELAKVSLVFLLAKNLSRQSFRIKSLSAVYLSHLFLLGALTFFLLKQPDFGSTFFLFVITFFMLFIAGLNLFHVVGSFLLMIPVAAWAIYSEPYRMKRILSFLNPWENMDHGGFQIIQSYLAFSNGGLLGSGFGNSKQKLFYLPEAHTDFILSVLAEELGFIGVLFIFLLFLYFLFICFSIMKACEDTYRKLLAFGLTALLALQIVVNIGVVLGLLPTKGSSLPFLSSGVSSLLTCMVCVGILSHLALTKDASTRHDLA